MFSFRRLPAFTVIEFLLVLVVIGVLLSLVIEKIDSAKERSYIATMQSDLRNYAQAQELYRDQHGSYVNDPANLPSYALSRDVFVVESDGSNTGWSLRLGHAGTAVTCSLEVGTNAGVTADHKIRCDPSDSSIGFSVSNTNPVVGEIVTFDATDALAKLAYDMNGRFSVLYAWDLGAVDRITWDFGDSSSVSGQPLDYMIVTHTYDVPGNYTVTLTLSKSDGGFARTGRTISVAALPDENHPPTAHFTYAPENPHLGEVITFTATATDPDDDSLSYHWDFGDGEIASGPVVQKSYFVEGTYDVVLTVSDEKGGEATYSETLKFTAGLNSIAQIVAGNAHTCALTVQGEAYCWGLNSAGQLGDSTTTQRLIPTPVVGDLAFTQLAVGASFTCGLTSSGIAYCWGTNSSGQLGIGNTTSQSAPTQVLAAVSFTQLGAGNSHACGVTSQGEMYCWGSNSYGELGIGMSSKSSYTPVKVNTTQNFASVAAGRLFACALNSSGAAYCWGFNGGKLGDGTTTNRPSPVLVTGDLTFAQISPGSDHTCALTTAGDAYCWGTNNSGELGNPPPTRYYTPYPVMGGVSFVQLTAGSGHTCGLTGDGQVYCWGRNNYGQLGDSTTTDRYMPAPINSSVSFVAITAGSGHTCGISTQGEVYCWGANDNGQLGDGTTNNSPVPVAISMQ